VSDARTGVRDPSNILLVGEADVCREEPFVE